MAGPPPANPFGHEESSSSEGAHGRRDTYTGSEASGDHGYRASSGLAAPLIAAVRPQHSADDSDVEGGPPQPFYARGHGAPSSESLMAGAQPTGPGYSGASSPNQRGYDAYPVYSRLREPYPAWTAEAQIPLSKEEIEDVFIDLTNKFGFQRDSMRNQYDHFMVQLDSRASRMSPNQALLTLHADYIGGEHANYRKWYFAAQLDLDDAFGQARGNQGIPRLGKKKATAGGPKALEAAQARWRQAMAGMSQYDRVRQIALYLLCWGEAAQVRFCPEALCFIFKCADDHYRSPECQNRVEAVPEGLYLRAVVRPLYRFMRDQGYEVADGVFVRRERDHDQIIGYDDVNQLFWYPEGINRIVLNDKTRLVDVPASQRFMKLDKVDWHRAFFKTCVVESVRPPLTPQLLRAPVVPPLTRQLQPHLGPARVHVLVLHGVRARLTEPR